MSEQHDDHDGRYQEATGGAVSFVAYPEGTGSGEVRIDGPWRYTDSPVCRVNGITVDMTDTEPGQRREVYGWVIERTATGIKAATFDEREQALQEAMPRLRAALAAHRATFAELRQAGTGEATAISKFYNYLLGPPEVLSRKELALLLAVVMSLLPDSAAQEQNGEQA